MSSSTSTISLFVKSPDTHSERRLDPHITISKLKEKLELITGVPASNQVLQLVDGDGPGGNSKAVAMQDDEKVLGFYSPREFQTIVVQDTNPSASFTGQLSDTSQVQKFELSEAEYSARQDSILAYKQRHKVGRFAPEPESPAPTAVTKVEIPFGSRCQVHSTESDLHKRGTVRFVGETEFAKGVWVGVEYDEPFGKNDGSVKGKKYFECRQNYGVFVKPDKLDVGDFPVEELDLNDEEEM